MSALSRLKLEEHKFLANLGYIARPYLKTKQNETKTQKANKPKQIYKNKFSLSEISFSLVLFLFLLREDIVINLV